MFSIIGHGGYSFREDQDLGGKGIRMGPIGIVAMHDFPCGGLLVLV